MRGWRTQFSLLIFYFEIISDLQEKCKTNTENCVPFTQIPRLWVCYHICLLVFPSSVFFLNHLRIGRRSLAPSSINISMSILPEDKDAFLHKPPCSVGTMRSTDLFRFHRCSRQCPLLHRNPRARTQTCFLQVSIQSTGPGCVLRLLSCLFSLLWPRTVP